jgi:hypothetical protein
MKSSSDAMPGNVAGDNSIQPQMDADKGRWKEAKTKPGTGKLSHQTVSAFRTDKMPLNEFLSASICVYLRFKLHGSGLVRGQS